MKETVELRRMKLKLVVDNNGLVNGELLISSKKHLTYSDQRKGGDKKLRIKNVKMKEHV